MRKWTLWLVVGVMALAFIGLLYMQINYINVVYRFRNEQFDSEVRHVLSEVNKEVERTELTRLVAEKLDIPSETYDLRGEGLFWEEKKNSAFNINDSSLLNHEQLALNGLKLIDTQEKGMQFKAASRAIMDQMQKRLDEVKSIIFELTMEMVRNNEPQPIYERISGKQLDEYISEKITLANITIPYVYEVVDKDQRVFYSTGKVPRDDSYSVYTQVLFSNDNPSRMYFLKIYFPGKRQYISSSMNFIAPSIIFSVLLLLIFIFTIVSLFRQKKIEELRNDFINNMTHELRTPVSTIMLSSQMLSDPTMLENDESRERVLFSIMSEGKRLDLLIDKVLQMSFFDKDKIKLKRKEVDIEELVLSVTGIFSLRVENYGGELDVELDANETVILGDEMHLTNIIFNLLDNAMKYRHKERPPMIKVTTSNDSSNVIVTIEDNGVGMKKEYLKKVFQRFFRVPTGNRHDVKGFGLGLAYVSKIVQTHKGSISAESELNRGTKFIIKLPLKKKG
ncbi:HAMP domain-containing sensor histidine kinase [Porphyromonadaceae bacterium W3.11]|nr:HAMP domain-containing sensor histidine kinase [Porphyromonadaceae bacterium W3.11]